MARLFHGHLPHLRLRGQRLPHPAAFLLLLLLAVLAIVWMKVPPVVSPLPIHPPG